MKYVSLVMAFLAFLCCYEAFADDGATVAGNNNVTQICQPKVEVVKSCSDSCAPRTRVKVVEKIVTVEKPVERIVEKPVETVRVMRFRQDVTRRNRINILMGYGAKGNLLEERQSNGSTTYSTENGPVYGAQYSRDLSDNLNMLIQAQTNRTISVGLGLAF